MKALSDRITKQYCFTHELPYTFLCIESDCQHEHRMMCDQCINIKKMDGLINIKQVFEFFESYQSQEDEMINQWQTNLLEEFKKSKVKIIQQLNQLESLIETLINSIRGNLTIKKLKTHFLECEINDYTIQSLGFQLIGKVIVDNRGQYQFSDAMNLIQQDAYIQVNDILKQQQEVIQILNNQMNLIDVDFTMDNDSMIDQVQCTQSYYPQDFSYSTGQIIKLDSPCSYLCFNHNESQIAAAVGKSIILFNLQQDGIWVQDKQSLIGHTSLIRQVKFNHNSTQMASCSDDKLVIIWCQQQNGQWSIQQQLNEHTGDVNTICYNNESTLLASGSNDESIIIYHLYNDKWKLKQKLCEHHNLVLDVCFNHDSSLLAQGINEDSIILWECDNVGNWIIKQKLIGHNSSVFGVSFNSQSSCLITGSVDRTIKFWSVDNQDNWQCTETLTDTNSVWSACFNKESNMISSSGDDGSIKIWKINKEKQWECTQIIKEHTNWINLAIINNDSSMIISGSDDQTILIYNRISQKQSATQQLQLSDIKAASSSIKQTEQQWEYQN